MQTNRQWIARRSKRAFRGARLDSSEDSASGRGFLFGDERLVRGGVRIGVNEFRRGAQRGIRFGDFSRHGSEDFADRLNGFDGAENFSGGDLLTDRGKLNKNNI